VARSGDQIVNEGSLKVSSIVMLQEKQQHLVLKNFQFKILGKGFVDGFKTAEDYVRVE
jgi:hypothetical protein